MLELNKIHNYNCLEGLKLLPDNFVNTIVTSPPYWGLRDYGVDDQLGLETHPKEYIERLVEIFNEARRVLREDGTLWLNIGDTYNTQPAGQKTVEALKASGTVGNLHESNLKASKKRKIIRDGDLKPKDLIGIPWMVAFALRQSGWYLRSEIIWHKPNAMPESVKDRPAKSQEKIFLFSKSQKYYYDYESIKEDTVDKKRKRNKRDVWSVNTKPFKEAHFAVFPEDLIIPCILAGSPEGGIVLDPFMGAGTTALVAKKLNRNFVGFELNAEFIEIANNRLNNI